MLWGRKVILQARNANGVQVDVAALRIDARCVRSRVFDDNELEATIHNANEDTISKFLQRGANVALFAGYEQGAEPGLMYQGNRNQKRAAGRCRGSSLCGISFRASLWGREVHRGWMPSRSEA